MTRWTAIVPFKTDGEGKTRLSGELDRDERSALSRTMLDKVASALAACPRIGRMLMVSGQPCPGWPGDWIEDPKGGLNAALSAGLEVAGRPAMIIHADLPLLEPSDLEALIDAADGEGMAIAPDRHGTGTNAVAIADDRPFAPRFGIGSFALHLHQSAGLPHVLVDRPGLGCDCDTLEDLALLKSRLGKVSSLR